MERFWSKVHKGDVCWNWTAARYSAGGYGAFWLNGGNALAHRVAFELEVGPIPEGMDLDHLCRNKACVNPEHLEPVTERENTLRGFGPSAKNARKTHCVHGHEFDEKNTYYYSSGGRGCRARFRANRRRYRMQEAA